MAMTGTDTTRSLFVTGLKNAHALEQQAGQIIERQLNRIENYPEVAARLRTHLNETHAQQKRLEDILGALNESPSTVKDLAAGFMGNMAALGHAPARDEVLKNTFANMAFENYEIASYKSLIAMAEMGNEMPAAQLLQESLHEEEEMAHWIDEHLRSLTMNYVERRERGIQADR